MTRGTLVACLYFRKKPEEWLFYMGELWERSQIHYGKVENYKYLQMFIQVPKKYTAGKKKERGNSRCIRD